MHWKENPPCILWKSNINKCNLPNLGRHFFLVESVKRKKKIIIIYIYIYHKPSWILYDKSQYKWYKEIQDDKFVYLLAHISFPTLQGKSLLNSYFEKFVISASNFPTPTMNLREVTCSTLKLFITYVYTRL